MSRPDAADDRTAAFSAFGPELSDQQLAEHSIESRSPRTG